VHWFTEEAVVDYMAGSMGRSGDQKDIKFGVERRSAMAALHA
jgi:hypothetical protein